MSEHHQCGRQHACLGCPDCKPPVLQGLDEVRAFLRLVLGREPEAHLVTAVAIRCLEVADAAEARGRDAGLSEAESAVAKVASIHHMRMQAIADDSGLRLVARRAARPHHMRMQAIADDSDRADAEAVEDDIAIEEVKADALEYAASHIRALRGGRELLPVRLSRVRRQRPRR